MKKLGTRAKVVLADMVILVIGAAIMLILVPKLTPVEKSEPVADAGVNYSGMGQASTRFKQDDPCWSWGEATLPSRSLSEVKNFAERIRLDKQMALAIGQQLDAHNLINKTDKVLHWDPTDSESVAAYVEQMHEEEAPFDLHVDREVGGDSEPVYAGTKIFVLPTGEAVFQYGCAKPFMPFKI